MSSRGGGDDDIERRLKELADTVNELVEILKAGFADERQAEREVRDSVDRWEMGTIRRTASTMREYIESRRKAATTDKHVPAMLDYNGFPNEEAWQTYAVFLKAGYANFDQLFKQLGKEKFSYVMRWYAMTAEHPITEDTDMESYMERFDRNTGSAINPELIFLAEPRYQFWGIRQDHKGNNILLAEPERMPSNFPLMRMYEYLWDFNGDVTRIGLEEGFKEAIPGRRDVGEVNQELALRIKRRDSVDLPAKYERLAEKAQEDDDDEPKGPADGLPL